MTVTATANAGYQFVNWTEGGTVVSSGPSYAFSATANRTLVANFAPATFTVDVSAAPTAGGTVNGGGTFSYDSPVTVTATANAGYQFVNWTEGGTVVSSGASYAFSATADRTLVANFAVPAMSITTNTTLPLAILGKPYSQTLNTTGGVLPYTWSVTSGSLPAGLTLNGSTGAITGTPNKIGKTNFTVQVSGSNGATAVKKFSIKVNSR